MKPLPARPEQFKTRCDRMIDNCRQPYPVLMRIPPIAASECKLILEAYYGGRRKAVTALARDAFHLWIQDKKWNTLLRFTDLVGWTKVYYQPGNADYNGYFHRHGYMCSGSPNCSNHHCIEDSLPMWFILLTRWDR